MGNIDLSQIGHHVGNILNGWWLLLTWMTGFWSVLIMNPTLSGKGMHREAEWAFFGGWFWLVIGFVFFLVARIFEYFF